MGVRVVPLHRRLLFRGQKRCLQTVVVVVVVVVVVHVFLRSRFCVESFSLEAKEKKRKEV